MRTRPLNAKLRRTVLERDDFTCAYCGHRPDFLRIRSAGTRWSSTLHVDHMVPASRGGLDDIKNLVTACADCNLKKHDSPWPFPVAYCAGCGTLDQNPPPISGDAEILGYPLHVCEPCQRDDSLRPPYEDEIAVEVAQWDHLAELAGF